MGARRRGAAAAPAPALQRGARRPGRRPTGLVCKSKCESISPRAAARRDAAARRSAARRGGVPAWTRGRASRAPLRAQVRGRRGPSAQGDQAWTPSCARAFWEGGCSTGAGPWTGTPLEPGWQKSRICNNGRGVWGEPVGVSAGQMFYVRMSQAPMRPLGAPAERKMLQTSDFCQARPRRDGWPGAPRALALGDPRCARMGALEERPYVLGVPPTARPASPRAPCRVSRPGRARRCPRRGRPPGPQSFTQMVAAVMPFMGLEMVG